MQNFCMKQFSGIINIRSCVLHKIFIRDTRITFLYNLYYFINNQFLKHFVIKCPLEKFFSFTFWHELHNRQRLDKEKTFCQERT